MQQFSDISAGAKVNPFTILPPAAVLDRLAAYDLNPARFRGSIKGSGAFCSPELAERLVSIFPSRLTPDADTWTENDAVELFVAIDAGDEEGFRGFAARIQGEIDGEPAPSSAGAAGVTDDAGCVDYTKLSPKEAGLATLAEAQATLRRLFGPETPDGYGSGGRVNGPEREAGIDAGDGVLDPAHEAQLRAAMAQHGIDATPQYFIPDRRWHRFAPTPGRKNQSAAYRIVPDPVAPVWWFRDWRMGGSLVRGQGDAGRELSPEETAAWKKRLKEHQRRAEKERLEGYAIESQRAQERWERAQLAPEDHEYLHHKRVQAHGLRVEDGCLLVPLSDIDGNLWSLLKIFPDGFKLNQEFARASECFYVIGDLKEAKTFSVCEGFATAATIFEATGSPVVSACYAGNLENVAPLLRERYPDATIFVCGDDDWLTKMNGQPHNTGKIAATNAARAINGILALPEFGPACAKGDTDFNDQYLRFGGLDKDGREDGLEAVRQTLLRAWKEHKRAPPEPEPPAAAPPFSEEDIALRFADRHADELRYIAAFGRWMMWRDTRWLADSTLTVFEMARVLVREAAAEFKETEKERRKLASARTDAAVERLSRADRCIAATIEQWDADPYLLGTPGGTVDLRTGELMPARRTDYITKSTTVTPSGDCPLWLAFLDRIMGGDAEMISFIQRMLGYGLTGITSEHAMFFLHGTGSNGKSKLLEAAAGIVGDYHRTAPIETFTESQSERHPTDLAGLHGARMVTAIETEEGRRWAESKIKSATGGDKMTARFMRQDFFDFVPKFKLIIAGNHKPSLRTVDEAIRRRLHFVPFAITIPENERDKDLGEKLKAEWPGILAWMIKGCLEWQRIGLAPPQEVRAATAAYLEAEDAIATWMAECCKLGPNEWTSSSALFGSWTAWAQKTGEVVGSQKAFLHKLEGLRFLSFNRKRPNNRKDENPVSGFDGIRMKLTYEE